MTAEERPDGPVEGCTHCKSKADMDLLGSIERETAPQWLMDDFGFSAMLTWGSERDFRWFVPRILELLADHPGMASGPETIASRLRMAGLDECPEPGQRSSERCSSRSGICGSTAADRGDGPGGPVGP